MGEDVKAFLGSGFKFPVQVEESTGRMKISSYEEDIKEAIYIILMTKKGERINNSFFGCGIHEYAFETMDYSSLNRMEREITEALELWEPRINNIDIELRMDEEREGCLLIDISYSVIATNNLQNVVFPYYISDGSYENAN